MKRALSRKSSIVMLAVIAAAAIVSVFCFAPLGAGSAAKPDGEAAFSASALDAQVGTQSLPDDETPLSDGSGGGAKPSAANMAKDLAALNADGTATPSGAAGASAAEQAKQKAEEAIADAESDPYAGGGSGGDGGGTTPGGSTSTATLSIDCASMLSNWDKVASAKKGIVPADGVIMAARTITFTPGETVFDVLYRECRASGILMSSRWTPMYASAYIEGIANIYEFDAGDLSGWMYSVNGWYPNYGCSQYTLQNGDVIKWRYTCDLGADVGGSGAVVGG